MMDFIIFFEFYTIFYNVKIIDKNGFTELYYLNWFVLKMKELRDWIIHIIHVFF